MKTKIAIIGYGQMGTALAKTLKRASTYDITVYDKHADVVSQARKRKIVAEEFPPKEPIDAAIIIIAVKPQDSFALLETDVFFNTKQEGRYLLVSVAAGVSLKSIAAALKKNRPASMQGPHLARIMPNVACLIAAGAGALSCNPEVTADEKITLVNICKRMGTFIDVPEEQLDAVTALSGSGPAFMMTALEAMSDAGVHLGLCRRDALTLAVHTMQGAATLVKQTAEHPALLRERVTSPGGTTIAGIRALESDTGGFRSALMSAIHAAYRRARSLARKSKAAHTPKSEEVD